MSDIARLTELRSVVEADPDSLRMLEWGRRTACGTTMCLAGHAMVSLAGYRPVWHETYEYVGGKQRRMWWFDEVVSPDGAATVRVEDAARTYLGLTGYDARVLFHTTTNGEAMERLENLIQGFDVDGDPLLPSPYEDAAEAHLE